jgi:hypothetical protein
MNLNEFFGNIKHNVNIEKNDGKDPRDTLTGRTEAMNQKLSDDLFWFILDHDKLHKEHFMPLAKKVSELQKNNKFDHGNFVKEWMPMVKKGCLEFYKQQKMEGHPADIFTKQLRKDLCYRLADQHHNDIEKGEYKLSEAKKSKNKKMKELVDRGTGATTSGPQYDTTGNNSLSETKKKSKVKKQRLDPKCWKGYRKAGTKVKGGVRVNNCVKVSESWQKEISKYIHLLEKKSLGK